MHPSPRLGRTRGFLAVLAALLLASTACSLPQTLLSQPRTAGETSRPNHPAAQPSEPKQDGGPAQPGPAGPQDGGPLPEVSLDGPLPELNVQPADFVPRRYPLPELGRVAFQADESAAAQREVAPDGAPQEMTVVDGAGLTWTLWVPTGAVDRPATLRMVPLGRFDGSALDGPLGGVAGGVRLEPDGLQFFKPLRLSVSGAALSGPVFILAGAHDGGGLAHALQDTAAQRPTARILHFSTYFAAQPQDGQIAAINQEAWTEYKRLSLEARSLLRSPLDVPEPPTIPLECTDEQTAQANDAALAQFLQNGIDPEAGLLARLFEQRKKLAFTGSGEMNGAGDLETALINRLGQKAVALMKMYTDREEKMVAVQAFALETARRLELLSGDQAVFDQIMSRLAYWNSRLIDKLIDEIRKNHRYTYIPVVQQAAFRASLMGANDDVGQYVEKLRAALRFEVRYTFTVNMPDILSITEVVVPLQFEPAKGPKYSCAGTGQGSYQDAQVYAENTSVAVSGYPVQAAVKDFDPCGGTVTVGFDRFGSDGDTITFTSEDGSETHPWPISRDAGESLFSEEFDGGMYWFELPLQNGNAQAANHTIARTKFEVVNGALEIELAHK